MHRLCEVGSWSIYSEWPAKIRCWLPTSARHMADVLITDIVCPPAWLSMERTCCTRSCGILYRIINRHVTQTNKPVTLMHRTICRMPMAMWELIAQISINHIQTWGSTTEYLIVAWPKMNCQDGAPCAFVAVFNFEDCLTKSCSFMAYHPKSLCSA